MLVYLETPRMLLRRFSEDDAGLLYVLDNDPDVMRFINGGLPTPRAVIEQQILPLFIERSEGVSGFWAAERAEDQAFLGWLSLRERAGQPHEAEIGYRFHKAVWGQGYAVEGMRALVDLAFDRFGLVRVLASTYEHNAASIRVMEKLGMRFLRSYRFTPEDLAGADTAHTADGDLWEGEDVEYVLERPSGGR